MDKEKLIANAVVLLQVFFILLQLTKNVFPNWWVVFLPLLVPCCLIGALLLIQIYFNDEHL